MKEYYKYSTEEFVKKAHFPVIVKEDNDTIFRELAKIMYDTIKVNNDKGEISVLVNPVGPTAHYKYFVQMVNENRLSLKDCWFINMDEYLTDDNEWIDKNNRLSFRGFMQKNVYDKIDPELNVPEDHRIFPNPKKLQEIPDLLKKLGKLDLVVGGIGITGHVAFNEPMPYMSVDAFLNLPTRTLAITPMTRATNACNDMHGAMEEMPYRAITIGMKEIFSAKRIVLGCFRDWHRGVVRHAACAEPTASFPVTTLQKHPNMSLYISKGVADYSFDD